MWLGGKRNVRQEGTGAQGQSENAVWGFVETGSILQSEHCRGNNSLVTDLLL